LLFLPLRLCQIRWRVAAMREFHAAVKTSRRRHVRAGLPALSAACLEALN
jgi:hypothetical protein